MSEERIVYTTAPQGLLKSETNSVTLYASTEADTMRAELVELERRLIPLLIAVQRALGKEPSVMTRARHREIEFK